MKKELLLGTTMLLVTMAGASDAQADTQTTQAQPANQNLSVPANNMESILNGFAQASQNDLNKSGYNYNVTPTKQANVYQIDAYKQDNDNHQMIYSVTYNTVNHTYTYLYDNRTNEEKLNPNMDMGHTIVVNDPSIVGNTDENTEEKQNSASNSVHYQPTQPQSASDTTRFAITPVKQGNNQATPASQSQDNQTSQTNQASFPTNNPTTSKLPQTGNQQNLLPLAGLALAGLTMFGFKKGQD